ncbi:MAG: cytidine/deoxycytidylate deaminase family protein [Patescibacteria group bacterium]|nr:cytidine/deoxycytidylate deaminase family protein [Patescibacteria group bacterium]
MGKYFRPSWDDYFMAIAKIIGTRGTCDRLRAGAVLVKNKRIISTGYNGAPPELGHCDDIGHLMEEGHCVRTIHGEHNAILQAAVLGGISTVGSTLYTLYNPCIHCAKYVVMAGIKRVVIGQIYRGEKALEYLKKAGLEVELYKPSPEWDQNLLKLFSAEIEKVEAKEGNVKLVEDNKIDDLNIVQPNQTVRPL